MDNLPLDEEQLEPEMVCPVCLGLWGTLDHGLFFTEQLEDDGMMHPTLHCTREGSE